MVVPYSGQKEGVYQVIINGLGLNGFSTIALKPGVENMYAL